MDLTIRAFARHVLWAVVLWAVVLWMPLLGPPPCSAAQDAQDVPEVVRRLLEEGSRHLRQNRLDSAVEVFEEARRLGPETVQVYLDLGAALARKGDMAGAKEAFEAGLSVEATNRDLLYNAAVVCLRLDESASAVAHMTTALEANGESADLLQVKAGGLARLERHEEALAALRSAERLEPKSARIQFALGNQLHRLARLDEAVVAFEQAAKLDPEQTRALYNLGAVWVEMGRYPDAKKAYEKALKPLSEALAQGQQIDPIHAVAYSNLGAAYSQLEDWNRAAEAYEIASKVDPALAEAQLNLGFAYFQLKKWKKAAVAYEQAVEFDENLSLAYVQLGEIRHREGKCDRAVDWFERGLPRLQADDRMRAMEGLARCYTDLGRVADAEQVFRRVLAEAPSDPKVLKDFGSVLRRRGRIDEARRALAKSLELRPDDLPTQLEALAVEEARADEQAQHRLLQAITDSHGERPNLWPVRRNLALKHLKAERWADARRELDALAANAQLPADQRPWVETALALISWSAGAGAREAVGESTPGSAAVALAERGEPTEALTQLDLLPPGPEVDGLKGVLAWSMGRGEEARSWLQAAENTSVDGPLLQIALASLELDLNTSSPGAQALDRLQGVREGCEMSGDSSSSVGRRSGVWVVRQAPTPELCAYAASLLRRALLGDGLALLKRNPGRALARARAVLGDKSADESQSALASFIEGSALLARGEARQALAPLQLALTRAPSARWSSSALNNLGMAWSRAGNLAEAEKNLRAAGRGSTEAILNLAILLHDQKNDPQAALALYETYLQRGGTRRQEVQVWVDRLRELYP